MTVLDLDPKKNWVIVPDLHGNHEYLLKVWEEVEREEDTNLLFLGDIVDRGPSSYKTFTLVRFILKSGRGAAVKSNHDKKFRRWIKHWFNADDDIAITERLDEAPTFGMQLSHGLDKTCNEFYELSPVIRTKYAIDFEMYYDTLPLYAILNHTKGIHYFSHAGICKDMFRRKVNDYTDSTVHYRATHTLEELKDVDPVDDLKEVWCHLGHIEQEFARPWMFSGTFPVDMKGASISHKKKYNLVKHDIGLGKRSLEELRPDGDIQIVMITDAGDVMRRFIK